jgi:hypothetical protein
MILDFEPFWSFIEDAPGCGAIASEWKRAVRSCVRNQPADSSRQPQELDRGAEVLYRHLKEALLIQTQRQADYCRCPRDCGCDHESVLYPNGEIAAVCRCDPPGCPPIRLRADDLTLFELSEAKLARAIAGTFGFQPLSPAHGRMPMIGRWGDKGRHVCLFNCNDSDRLVAQLENAFAVPGTPLVLVVPTMRHINPTIHGMLLRNGCIALPLSEYLGFSVSGQFAQLKSLDSQRDELERRVAESSRTGPLLKSIEKKISDVGKEQAELRSAKAYLEDMLANRYFALAERVGFKSFNIFFTVMAKRSFAAAAKELKTPASTLNNQIAKWKHEDDAHKMMHGVLEWRRKHHLRIKVPANLGILRKETSSVDYPGLLSDVLDGLIRMTESEDWEAICEELKELLRPYVDRGPDVGEFSAGRRSAF